MSSFAANHDIYPIGMIGLLTRPAVHTGFFLQVGPQLDIITMVVFTLAFRAREWTQVRVDSRPSLLSTQTIV